MDHLPDSRHSGAEESLRGVSVGALLIAIVIVLAAVGAGLLVAGAFLVAGA